MTKPILLRRVGLAVFLCLVAGSGSAQEPWARSLELEMRGDYAGAIVALEPIVDADSEHEYAILRMAWLKYLLGNYNASVRDYRLALELNEQSIEARLGLTLPLLAQRRWREAAAYAEEVLSVAPWNYYAHIRLMVAEEGQLQWQTLAGHAREMAARFPTDATVLVYLARAEARQGNLEAALEAYRKVLERYPTHLEASAFVAQNSG